MMNKTNIQSPGVFNNLQNLLNNSSVRDLFFRPLHFAFAALYLLRIFQPIDLILNCY